MIKIVFATNNKNKIKEVQKLLPANIELIGLRCDVLCLLILVFKRKTYRV